jgi:hypothetical protein
MLTVRCCSRHKTPKATTAVKASGGTVNSLSVVTPRRDSENGSELFAAIEGQLGLREMRSH